MKDPRLDPITHILHYHPDYLAMEADELFIICNGCGSAGSKFDFVPDTIYGINITAACCIHDHDYYRGKTDRAKRRADERFLMNMLAVIEHRSQNRLTRSLRSCRAMKYYCAVRDFGDKAFWSGKDREI